MIHVLRVLPSLARGSSATRLAQLCPVRTFGLVLCALTAVLVGGCGSDDPAPGSTDAGTGGPGVTPGVATCNIRDVTGATTLTAEFLELSPPAVVAPMMTGGPLTGRFKGTRARVYLPQETASFTDPTKSSGTTLSWAAFEGNAFRLHLEIDIVVSSSFGGDQPQKTVADLQGTFTTNGAALLLDASCGAAPGGTPPEYTFTSTGTAATLLIKTKVGPLASDSYVAIDAVSE